MPRTEAPPAEMPAPPRQTRAPCRQMRAACRQMRAPTAQIESRRLNALRPIAQAATLVAQTKLSLVQTPRPMPQSESSAPRSPAPIEGAERSAVHHEAASSGPETASPRPSRPQPRRPRRTRLVYSPYGVNTKKCSSRKRGIFCRVAHQRARGRRSANIAVCTPPTIVIPKKRCPRGGSFLSVLTSCAKDTRGVERSSAFRPAEGERARLKCDLVDHGGALTLSAGSAASR